jgi:hypothetical protein
MGADPEESCPIGNSSSRIDDVSEIKAGQPAPGPAACSISGRKAVDREGAAIVHSAIRSATWRAWRRAAREDGIMGPQPQHLDHFARFFLDRLAEHHARQQVGHE